MQTRHFAAAVLSVFATIAPALRAANIPRKAPDFAISLTNGKQVTLSQHKGKVIALVFILTNCPHCQGAVRCLSQEQKEFGASGFQVLGSAIEDMARINVPDFIRRFDPPFPVGYNKDREAIDFMQHPTGVPVLMPLIAFVDREGIVRAQFEGYEPFFAEDKMAANIHAKIKELMVPIAPTKSGIRKKAAPRK